MTAVDRQIRPVWRLEGRTQARTRTVPNGRSLGIFAKIKTRMKVGETKKSGRYASPDFFAGISESTEGRHATHFARQCRAFSGCFSPFSAFLMLLEWSTKIGFF